ncbi:hypothetical protein L596_012188 [Steinernema carpocapsae]|uniref:Fungal lipase-type domain-containing protein n=1 Tax=Steinernema carpocapsae TaxID=34508 RepID=A0A4U5NX58_STECR|nr:hypothetical protein L596_012188 [Steinernema carpocapsae]
MRLKLSSTFVKVRLTPNSLLNSWTQEIWSANLRFPVRSACSTAKRIATCTPLLQDPHGGVLPRRENCQPRRHGHRHGHTLEKVCPEISVGTFGEPKVGDATFVTAVGQQLPDYFRVVNKYDPIPLFPWDDYAETETTSTNYFVDCENYNAPKCPTEKGFWKIVFTINYHVGYFAQKGFGKRKCEPLPSL